MIATNHALTGTAIAIVIQRPLLAIPLSFLSHFICDTIPHFGIDMKFRSRSMYTWLAIDGALLVVVASLLLVFGVSNLLLIAVCGFVAMLPDLAWLYYGIKQQLGDLSSYDFVTKIHHKIQWYQKVPGIVVEVFWATLMVSIILGAQT